QRTAIVQQWTAASQRGTRNPLLFPLNAVQIEGPTGNWTLHTLPHIGGSILKSPIATKGGGGKRFGS
ncbi:hypothetical protein Ancab_029098, partial [Ancistrocladus abbreviatus]